MPTTPADIRNAVLMSVATVAAGFVVPSLPFVGLPLAAFALGWLTYRFGPRAAALLAVVAGGCVAVIGPLLGLVSAPADGAFVAAALLAVGPAAAVALRRYPAVNVAGAAALAVTVAFLVAPIGVGTRGAFVAGWSQGVAALPPNANVDPATAKAAMQAVFAWVLAMWPALTFYMMGIGTAIGVPLIGRAARSLGQDVRRYGSLADVDVAFAFVWPTIVGFALAAVGSLWKQAPALVGTAGANVLMIVRPFLFLQGVAVFAALYRRMGAGRVTKTIGFVLLVLTESLAPLVSLSGLVDLFANFRKVPRGRSASGAPA